MPKNNNKASLAIHAFVDNLDNAHYDASDNKLEYNLGEIIQNGFFSNVDIVIVKSPNTSVRGAKRTGSDNFAIVIQTPELPEVGKVDDFIENSKIAIPLIKQLAMVADHLEEVGLNDPEKLTDYEQEKRYNDKEFFENAYMTGVKKMNQYLSRLEDQIASLEQKAENSGLASRKSTYKMAIDKLKDDTIGGDAKKFSTKFYDLIEEEYPNFKKLINSDNKKRLESRINQFYKKVSSKF